MAELSLWNVDEMENEKEINTIQYTKNIYFQESYKIVENSNKFLIQKPQEKEKYNHTCESYHTILGFTPDTLQKFLADLWSDFKTSPLLHHHQIRHITTKRIVVPTVPKCLSIVLGWLHW